jgi:hypothetical protein
MWSDCSPRSSPPNPVGWAWGYRFAVRSSTRTGAASGLPPMSLTARPSSSPCLRIQRLHREPRISEMSPQSQGKGTRGADVGTLCSGLQGNRECKDVVAPIRAIETPSFDSPASGSGSPPARCSREAAYVVPPDVSPVECGVDIYL